jgi:uncharacterized hydrophobic protein (TIGR00271 family)
MNDKQKRILRYYWLKSKRFTSLYHDSDGQATIARIKEGIIFRETNVWILAFAIIIASVGLNINAPAVIIGAMLISPLMGPIMGIGLAVGIYDFSLLKKSLENFAYMVIISLIASTLYFYLSPLSDAQSELLARTSPSIYDVLIAFFGGLSGIVANSRKGEKTTIVSGVAIATALMPPLCTAGYGLATGEWKYFFGAFYLFFINSFFIALATAIIVHYIKLPKCTEINPRRAKKIKRYIYLFAFLICIPSIFLAIGMIKESAFNSNAIQFMNSLKENPLLGNAHIVSSGRNYGGRDSSTIMLTIVTYPPLNDEQVANLQNSLIKYGLKKTKLAITQITGNEGGYSENENSLIEDLVKKNTELTQELTAYKGYMQQQTQNTLNNKQIAKEIRIQFDNITYFAFGRMEYISIQTLDTSTVPSVFIYWSDKETNSDTTQFNNWLRVRLDMPDLRIHHKYSLENTSK